LAQLDKASPEAAADDLIDKAIINTDRVVAVELVAQEKTPVITDMNIGQQMAAQVSLQIF
jgi:hypothetical protein